MKNLRWLLAGFAMGALLALSPACSPKPRCTASNCTGCCDGKDSCQGGLVDQACGAHGSLCAACSLTQTCQLGLCTAAFNTTCSADTCYLGCCSAGTCTSGNSSGGCGRNGDVCSVCAWNQSCQSGVCVTNPDAGNPDAGGCGPGNCAGCCSSGLCVPVPQQSATRCGTNGAACVGCGTGNSCSAGSCTGPSACTPANCATGCCSGTGATATCLTGIDNFYCGNNGAACVACISPDTCNAQACGSATPCNPACTTGCCAGGGICMPGVSDVYCGSSGNCQTCNVSAGQTCISQVCTGGSVKAVGDPCTSAGQCVSLGTGYTCKLATNPGGFTYPQGYCTKDCTADSDCPTGTSFCKTAGGAYGEADTFCWKSCPNGNECRTSGYNCWSTTSVSGTTVKGCWLDPLPPYDAGPPATNIGGNCTLDTQCQNPPDDGFCLAETLSDGGPSGWTYGYCSSDCVDNAHCGANGVCLAFTSGSGPNFNLCMKRCPAPMTASDCGTGYVCDGYLIGLPDGGTENSTDGYCWPHCNVKPCGSGTTCQPSGFCQ